jgi:hypothetical protein
METEVVLVLDGAKDNQDDIFAYNKFEFIKIN